VLVKSECEATTTTTGDEKGGRDFKTNKEIEPTSEGKSRAGSSAKGGQSGMDDLTCHLNPRDMRKGKIVMRPFLGLESQREIKQGKKPGLMEGLGRPRYRREAELGR